jgi:hypothetical protein
MSQPSVLSYGFAGNLKYGRYYQHSGQLNLAGVFFSLVAGIAAAATLAIAYAYAIIHFDIDKARLFAWIVFGCLLGVIPSLILGGFKVRNTHVALAVVLVVSAVGFYASWTAWESILLRKFKGVPAPMELALRPVLIGRIAQGINTVGTWSEQSSSRDGRDPENTKGAKLTAIWIIEGLGIFGFAIGTAAGMSNSRPFCEKCDRWAGRRSIFLVTGWTDPKTLREQLELGNFASVRTLPSVTAAGKLIKQLEFSRFCCPGCGEFQTLSVKEQTITVNKKGTRKQTRMKTVINKLMISEADYQQMRTPTSSPASAAEARRQ